MLDFFEVLPFFSYLIGMIILISLPSKNVSNVAKTRKVYHVFDLLSKMYKLALSFFFFYFAFVDTHLTYSIQTEGGIKSLEDNISSRYIMRDSHFSKLLVYTVTVEQKEIREIRNKLIEEEIPIHIVEPSFFTKKEIDAFHAVSKKEGFENAIYYVENHLNKDLPNDVIVPSKKEGGGSDGLVMTLELIHQFGNEDLIKGNLITGTGTISPTGDVGEIGGIDLKIKAAEESNYDYCFVPKAQQEEATDIVKDYEYKIRIVPVTNVEEALSFLRNLN